MAQLKCLETDNLRLIYFDYLSSYLAPHLARCFENSYQFHSELWDYKSSEKITIFLHDFTDYGNGGAKNVPENLIMVDISPFSYAYETVPVNERMNTLMNHELVHIVAMDKASGRDKFFRHLFMGKIMPTTEHPETMIYDYLATPRRSGPRWYQEGIAVFMETWMSGGFGRALGAYDEMVFRTKVRDSARFYDPVGLEAEGTSVDFHVGVNSYLHGTRFFCYLAYQYGPDKLIQWTKRTNGSKSYFASQFKKTFGTSLDDEWRKWVDWEHEFQETNLDSIHTYPTTDYELLTDRGLGSVSRGFYDRTRGQIIVAVNYPGEFGQVASIDLNTKKLRKICDIKGPALFFVSSTAYDSTTGNVFFTEDNYAWRDLVVVNIDNGKKRTLLKDARIGDLAFNYSDSSLWGVRHTNGISSIVRIPYPYREWNLIWSLSYGYDIYDLDISPDGSHLSGALAKINGWQSLVLMNVDNLMSGDTTFQELYDFGNSNPEGFVFSGDCCKLYGSSYYTGVSNIFRYDLDLDSMDCLSNCETGFFRPIPTDNDSLIVFCYTGQGFIPAIIEEKALEDVSPTVYLGTMTINKYPELKNWMVGSPAQINLDSMNVKNGDYRAFSHVRPTSLYPIVEGYDIYTAAGLRMDMADPMNMNRFDLAASYSPAPSLDDDQKWHIKAGYSKLNWKINFKYNAADFYDLFGPTKTSRKGYSLGISHNKSLIYEEPKTMDLNFSLTGYGGLERLPDYQNIATTYDKFLNADIGLNYSNMVATLGAVDYEKGMQWNVDINANYVNKRLYPLSHTQLDLGVKLFYHSSIWLRQWAGYSPGEHRQPFANFYFGGFGNNWVDYRYEKRYRQYYSFPGTELNAIGGTNFYKAIFEWNLPPLRFRRLGGQALYCTWVRPALFSSGIITNIESSEFRRKVANLGAQLDFRFQLLSHLRLTYSIGYAAAFEKGRVPSDEFMMSLKIL